MIHPVRIPAWLSVPAIIFVVALLYGPAVYYPFVWTDHGEIEQGAMVPETMDQVIRTLTMAKGSAKETSRSTFQGQKKQKARYAYYRPVKSLSYGLDNQVGQGDPAAYHLTNILLHLGCCLLLLWLVGKITDHKLPGLAEGVALLHALNPLHVETVAWISARSDSMVALFSLGAMALLLKSRSISKPWLLQLAAGLLACLALGSKESGIVCLGLLGLTSLLLPDPAHPAWFRRLVRECWLPLLMVLGLVAFRLLSIGDIQLGALGGRKALGLYTLLHLFGQNLWLSFAPFGNGVADTVQVRSALSLHGIVGPLAWLSWVGLGLFLRRKQPLVLLCSVAWLFSIAPVSQVLPLLHPRGDRYLYLPTIFAQISLVALVIHTLNWSCFPRLLRPVLVLCSALLLTFYAHMASKDLERWSDERVLFGAAVQEQENCSECWNNLAYSLAIAGRYEQAAQACQRALVIDRSRYRGARDGFSLRFILARSLLVLKRGPQAIKPLEEILVKAGPSPNILLMLSEALLQSGRYAHALACAEWALRLKPGDAQLRRLVYHAARREHDAGFPWLFRFPEGCLLPEGDRP